MKLCPISGTRVRIEKAMEIENQTVERMSEVVDLSNLQDDARPDKEALDGLVAMGQVEPCDPPEGLQIATAIIQTQVDEPKTSELRRTRPPWWAMEEEEEDEDGAGDGGGDGAGGS